MPGSPLRIFSDLHFRDPRGELHDLADFSPLLGDAERVVFNGDSLDTQVPAMARHAGELLDFTRRSGRVIDWLSGNHDPDFSERAELSLCDGRVWVTHGDVFFPAIAPWSHHAAELRRRFDAEAAGQAGAELRRVETLLHLHRKISRSLPEPPHFFRPGLLMRFYRLAHAILPPSRLVEMVRAWKTTPRLVAELARAQRPEARVVVLGHTHYPGVWRVPGRQGSPDLTVVNTGSFTRPLGGLLVELHGDCLRVIRIARRGRSFAEGRPVAELSVALGS
jgi:predicted phosphodiesterase